VAVRLTITILVTRLKPIQHNVVFLFPFYSHHESFARFLIHILSSCVAIHMSLFLLRPAVVLLATICACPPAHAEATSNGMVFGPDSNGVCYEGSAEGDITPCPTQVHGHLPKSAIAGIVVAAVFVLALLLALFFWRRQVRATTDDSASSLFDFVPATREGEGDSPRASPSSPHFSIRTMIGSQSVLNEKADSSYFHHDSKLDEGSVETPYAELPIRLSSRKIPSIIISVHRCADTT